MSLFRRRSTRDLLGIQEIREHTVRTVHGERSYFILTPTNISVLSREGVAGRIQSLMEVLKSLDRAEVICMDGSESFLRAAFGLEVFAERELISLTAKDDRLVLRLQPGRRADLEQCPYVGRLRQIQRKEEKGDR